MVEVSTGAEADPNLLAGRYQLLKRLGEGGMGVVWRSFDLDLEEMVAIKILRNELARDEFVCAFFRREVKLARRVTHPHVARVFEFGRDGGSFFLTMEFIPGPTLHEILGDGPLPVEQVHAIAVGLCRGLAAAHTAGVIHGDIKPGNILLHPERGAVVTDFGIARALSEADTGADVIAGTPLYMAPEQTDARAQTQRSDVYAVGVVLYQALTGRAPWPDDDLEALRRLKEGGAPDMKALPAGLPRGWGELIAGCLEADPGRRPVDARELLVHLGALRGSLPVKPKPVQASAPAPVSGLGPKWIEVMPFTSTADDLNGSGAWITGDLRDALSQQRGLRVAAPSGEAPPHSHTQVLGSMRPVGDSVVIEIQVVDEGARSVGFEIQRPRTELANLGAELAAKITATLRPEQRGSPPQTSEVLAPEVATLYLQAREAMLDWRMDDALRLFEVAGARAPGHRLLAVGRSAAWVMATAVTGQASAAQLASARKLAEEAVALHGDVGQAQLDRAIVLDVVHDPVRSAASLRAALHRAPSLVMAHTMMAEQMMQLGRLPDAERHLDIGLALNRRSVQVWSGLAALRARQGRFAEFEEIVEGELDPRLRTLTRVRWTLGRADEAALERLAAALAGDPGQVPASVVARCRDIVALQRADADHEPLFARLEAAHPEYTSARARGVLAQMLCELACVVGDLPRARRWLMVADQHTLIDRQWLESSPALTRLRGEPLLAEVAARVQVRADAVGEAIWG